MTTETFQVRRTADLSSNNETQRASERLLSELSDNVFEITSGSRGFYGPRHLGTGWLTEDGRLVCLYSAIRDQPELFAEQNGKRYRIGRNLRIDSDADLAVMDFVEKRPAHATGIRIGETQTSGRVFILGHDSEAVSKPTIVGINQHNEEWRGQPPGAVAAAVTEGRMQGIGSRMEIFPGTKVKRYFWQEQPSNLNVSGYLRGCLVRMDMQENRVEKGGPVLSLQKEVIGILDRVEGTAAGAIPVHLLHPLLDRNDSHNMFSTEFESSAVNYMRNWQRNPHLAFTQSAPALAYLGAFSAAATGAKWSSAVGISALGLISGWQCWNDYKSYSGSTDSTDRTKYTLALLGDGITTAGTIVTAAGMVRRSVKPIGFAIAAAGLAQRASAELVPNHYVIANVHEPK